MLVSESTNMPYMKSLVTCLNRIIAEGYTEDFKLSNNGLEALQQGRKYRKDQVTIINFFRFEGAQDPEDNAVLYVIKTDDGIKGTLIDAYGLYNDERIARFFNEIGTNNYTKQLKYQILLKEGKVPSTARILNILHGCDPMVKIRASHKME